MAKVSIIIAAYNLDKCIARLLDSVSQQTFQDIEIVVVNDGSTDNTLSIINQYAATDSRIIVVDQPNGGLVSARKSGLKNATSQYVWLIDGDDFIEKNAVEILYNRAQETKSDIVVLDFWFEEDGSGVKRLSRDVARQHNDSVENYLRKIYLGEEYWAVWSYIFKRDLYDSTIISPNHITYGEDAILTTQLLLRAKTINFVNIPLYHYVLRSNSITSVSKLGEHKYNNLIEYPQIIRNIVEASTYGNNFNRELEIVELRAFMSIHSYNYNKNIFVNMPRVALLIDKYPDKAQEFSNRYIKLLKTYKSNKLLAKMRYLYYVCRRKRI